MTQPRSLAADIAFACAVLGAGMFAFGPGGSYLGVLSPLVGFSLAGLALPLAAIALVAGVIGLVRTRAAAGRQGRPRAWAGVGYGVVAFAVFGTLLALRPSTPRINDITTDFSDPPHFAAAASAPENAGRNLDYPRAFATEQRQAYPDVRSIVLQVTPDVAFERALGAIQRLHWKVVDANAAAGQIEAYDVSRVFQFVDDVVVRIRARGNGSVIDVRSKSRNGQGDMGANAARIRAFEQELRRGS